MIFVSDPLKRYMLVWAVTLVASKRPSGTGLGDHRRTTNFTGLAPGVVYDAHVNAVGAAGPSDWINPVSKMAG